MRATPDGVDGLSAASVFSGPVCALSYPRAAVLACVGGPYDDPVGSRQRTFSSSHLMVVLGLSVQATACWDAIAPSQYCSSADHVCTSPRGEGMASWGGTEFSGTNRGLS